MKKTRLRANGMNPVHAAVVDFIEEKRNSRSLSRKELAEKANFSEYTISRFMNNGNGGNGEFNITFEFLVRIALALQLSPSEFIMLYAIAFRERIYYLLAIWRGYNLDELYELLKENELSLGDPPKNDSGQRAGCKKRGMDLRQMVEASVLKVMQSPKYHNLLVEKKQGVEWGITTDVAFYNWSIHAFVFVAMEFDNSGTGVQKLEECLRCCNEKKQDNDQPPIGMLLRINQADHTDIKIEYILGCVSVEGFESQYQRWLPPKDVLKRIVGTAVSDWEDYEWEKSH